MKKIVYILLLLTISLSIINVNAMELPTERWTNKYSKYSGSQMTGHFSDYMYDINSNKGALSENIYNYNSNIIVVDSSIGREKPVDEQDNYSERIIKSYSSRNKKNWEKEYTLNSFQFYKNYLFALNKYNSVVDCIDLQTGETKFHISVDTAYTTTPEKIFVNDNYIFLVYTSGRNLYVDKVKYNGQIVSNNYYNLEEIYPSDLLSDYDENKVMSFNNNKILVADKNTIITINVDNNETNTIVRTDKYPINRIRAYKDGYLICGTKTGQPIIQYIKDNNIEWTVTKEGNGKYNSFDFTDNEIIAVGGIYNNSEYNNTNIMIPFLTSISNDGTENYSNSIAPITSDNNTQIYGVKLFNDSIVVHGDDGEEKWRYDTTNAFTTLFRNNNPLAVTYYNIETNIIGDGLVLVDTPNRSDAVIRYTTKGNLISLEIKTKSGEVIEIEDDNSFIMPDEDVIITAVFKKQDNPKTNRNIIIAVSALLITIITTLAVFLKKKKINN